MVEFNYETIPGYKLGLHIMQIIFSFAAWCIEIAVFRAEGSKVNGQNGWTFGVCFLSVPAWIYLVGAPRWPRTCKIANPYAMMVVDGLFTVLWLSAFATQASYNTANLCGAGCSLSKAIVGLAFFVTLFFAATTTLSVFTLRYWKFNDRLPGYDNTKLRPQNIDPDKAAFSMAPHDEEAYAPVNIDDHEHDPHDGYSSAYGGSAAQQDPYQHDPFQQQPQQDPFVQDPYHATPAVRPGENPFDDHTEYQPQTGTGRVYAPPTAHDEYDEDRPAQFPAGNYDRTVR